MESKKISIQAESISDEQLDDVNGGFSFDEMVSAAIDPCTLYNPDRRYVNHLCKNCSNFMCFSPSPGEPQYPYCDFRKKFFKDYN